MAAGTIQKPATAPVTGPVVDKTLGPEPALCDVDLRSCGFSAVEIQFEFAAVAKAVLGN